MSTTQILVVEDERLVAVAIQNELEQFGYQVSGIASTAQEALEKAGESKPDLVLMDIHLKGESDGIQAARNIHDRYGIPIVYLSAFSDPETLNRASDTEAFGYLLKPYEERELHTTIEMAIAKHRAEAKLEETKRWMAAIHQATGDAVIAIDPEKRIRFLNPATEIITGCRSEDAIGAPVESVCQVISGGQHVALEPLIDKVVNTGRHIPLPEHCWVVSQQDHQTPVEGTIAAIHDSRGDFLGTVLTLRNIGARLEVERLRLQNERRRQHVQRMEVVSRVAGGLAHPLNNLLTAILGNASLALAQITDDSEAAALLERVEVAAQRAAELVQRLLVFSKLSGRPAGHWDETNVNVLIPKCLREIDARLHAHLTIRYKPRPDIWSIAGDELLLGQVFLELALNARDAMPRGGNLSFEAENVVLREEDLASHPTGRVGEFVRLRISDTGGLHPTADTHPLEPGFVTKPAGEATGLGLALITAIAEQMHGWIESVSQAQHGSQLELYLPRYGTDLATSVGSVAQEKPHGTTPTIMLADADPMVRDIGRRILQRHGYRVLLAEDGVQAVAMYQQEPQQIELVIIDLNIPRLTAYAVLERLMESDPHVRVLFSGGFMTEDLTAGQGHTMGVITKPYHQEELLEMVCRALAQRSTS